MPTVLSPSAEHKILGALSYSNYCPPPVPHGGSLHWCPFPFCGVADITGGSGDIVVFDTEAESFQWMRGPVYYSLAEQCEVGQERRDTA